MNAQLRRAQGMSTKHQQAQTMKPYLGRSILHCDDRPSTAKTSSIKPSAFSESVVLSSVAGWSKDPCGCAAHSFELISLITTDRQQQLGLKRNADAAIGSHLQNQFIQARGLEWSRPSCQTVSPAEMRAHHCQKFLGKSFFPLTQDPVCLRTNSKNT